MKEPVPESAQDDKWSFCLPAGHAMACESGETMSRAKIAGRLRQGRVDGFDQGEAESKRDERAVILRCLLASKRDTLEALELADCLFNACPRLVECFRREGGRC
jgi:hypothetical protein